MHEEVCARLGHEPSRRTRIELMPDHEWFGVRLTGLPAIHTIAACTGPVIAMEVPREGSRKKHLGLFDWLDVVRHGYVHTVTLSQTRNRIPHWMTEAIAVDLQHKRRDYKDCQMLAAALEGGTLFDFDSILLAFVRPAKPTDRAQAYAQGHWWVEFIRETWGDEALRRMLALYAEGSTESQVLAQVLEVSKEEFLQRFTPWARAQVKAWGLAPEPPADALLGKDRVEPVSDKELELLLRTHPDHPDLLELAVRRRTERGEGVQRASGYATIGDISDDRHLKPLDTPKNPANRQAIQQPLGRMLVPAVTGIDHRAPNGLCKEVRTTGNGCAHHQCIHAEGLHIESGIQERLTLARA